VNDYTCEDEVQAMILADMGAQPFFAVGRRVTVRTLSRKKISWRWDMLRKTNGLTAWKAWFSKLGGGLTVQGGGFVWICGRGQGHMDKMNDDGGGSMDDLRWWSMVHGRRLRHIRQRRGGVTADPLLKMGCAWGASVSSVDGS